MADKTSPSGAAGRAPEADRPQNIRNVVLVGHSGSGKTTLAEHLYAHAAPGGSVRPGRVEDGSTISDFDEVEARQQRSVNLSVVPLEYDGVKVNLIDAPGYADFVGDLRAGLRAEKISEVAAEFDGIHDIHRAVDVGSVDEVVTAAELRPKVIAAMERGGPSGGQTG